MKALSCTFYRAIWLIITLLVIPVGLMAQDAGDSDQAYKFSKEELTQMLAPIALYPDGLSAQILMASTYPLEVVEADRWIRQNSQLKGDDLDSALLNKTWDPSVKSICHFPDILNSMSEKLDQTRKLGDAFLGQEADVMATIQELRSKAMAQGNLKSTHEQKVIVDNENVRIEPVNPDVIYVPVYDPAYVYGPWWYPAYPPYYWYYPTSFYGGAYISFAPGIYFGFNAFSWVWFDWSYHRIHTDIIRTRYFNRNYGRRDNSGSFWRHNPAHRKGVAYRDLRTSDRFGSRVHRELSPLNLQRRGYPAGRIEGQSVRSSRMPAQGGERQIVPQASQRRRTLEVAPRDPVRDRGGRDTPFSGIGRGSFERRAGERGGISNRGTESQPGGSYGGQRQRR